MKSSKKTMLVIAVTLLLAAALFVGAAAAEPAADDKGWIEAVSSDPGTEAYVWDETNAKVTVKKAEGLAWFANQLMKANTYKGKVITVEITDNLDMGDHWWVSLSTNEIDYSQKELKIITIKSDSKLVDGLIFEGQGHTISHLWIENTLQCPDAKTLGTNNHYCSGFVGYAGVNVTFNKLTFDNVNVCPNFTSGLADDLDNKGYNQIGAVVGNANAAATFTKVTVKDSQVNGTSKVGAFVGATGSGDVKFEECTVDNVKVTGFDSVGKLIGYVGKSTGKLTIDAQTEITSNVAITTAIYSKEGSDKYEKYLPYEILGYVDKDGTAHALWTLDGSKKQTTVTNYPATKEIAYIIKGELDTDGKIKATGAKIRSTKADLYNQYGTTWGKKTIADLYVSGDRLDIGIESDAVNAFEAAVGTEAKGFVCYPTLQEAVNAAATGDTIKLLKNVMNGAGLKIGDTDSTVPGRTITIDLGGFTYTIDGAKAIRADVTYQTQGIRVGNTQAVAIQNGTLNINDDNAKKTEGQRVVWLINNYGALILGKDVTIDGSNVSVYSAEKVSEENVNAVVFSNTGSVSVSFNASITAPTGVPALYVGWFKDYPKKGGASGTVCEKGTNATIATSGTIDGAVAFKMYYSDVPDTTSLANNGPKLTVIAGNLKGGLEVDSDIADYAKKATKSGDIADKGILIYGGIIGSNPDGYLRADCVWDSETGAVGKKAVIPDEGDKKEVNPDEPMTPVKDDVTAEVETISMPKTEEKVKAVVIATTEEVPGEEVKEIKETFSVVDIKPVNDAGEKVDPTEMVELTFTITFGEGADIPVAANIGVAHFENNEWKVIGKGATLSAGVYTIKVSTKNFSPFAVVEVKQSAAPSKSSSSSQGSSVWLTNDTPVEPKVTATPTPTPGPVETPSVKPIENPSDVPAKTPAPFLGILAGLGAAAVVFGLRRK